MKRSQLARLWNLIGGRLLFRVGRVGRLTTRGRRTHRPRVAYVGFASLDRGRYVIGAGGPGRSWAANLRADPICTFETRHAGGTFRARLLTAQERAAGEAALLSRLGRWARRVQWGEIFELVPEGDGEGEPMGPAEGSTSGPATKGWEDADPAEARR